MAERDKPWTQKYSPKNSADVVGQGRAISELKSFVAGFKKGKKKAMLLYGPTGVGKTCSVHAVAKEQGLEIVELNASDFRTAEDIKAVIGTASKQMSLFFKGKIILIDEIDGVSGTKDRGGMPAISGIIEETAFPIVMTLTDPFDKKFSEIRKQSILVEFEVLGYEPVFEVLNRIAKEEGIKCDENILKAIARRVGGDVRAAINDLQILGTKGSIKKEELDVLSDREKVEEITTALTKIFKTTDPVIAKESFNTVSEDINECLMWVDENIPKEYTNPDDLARAYDYISKADIMNRRITRWQHWRFLVYVSDYLSAGVAVAKKEKYKKMVNYERSERPLKIWMANRKYQKRMAICEKIAEVTHTSKKEAVKDTYPYVKAIFKEGKNKELFFGLVNNFGLDKDEIDYLRK
jgi:replication factor C large subunit